MEKLDNLWHTLLQHPRLLLTGAVGVVVLLIILSNRKQFAFILKSLSRNKLRTILTALATIVLVLVVTGIWTVLYFLDLVTEEKTQDFKVIITEKHQVPSQMPYAYAATLEEGAAARPGDVRPDDSMTWSFYGGTLDPAKMTRENIVFFFVMDPRKLRTMMDNLHDFDKDNAIVNAMLHNKRGVIMGRDRLRSINKRVGERFKLTSLNYKEIDLEFEIVGEFPEGQYNQMGVMNISYLLDSLDDYKKAHQGTKHPLHDKALNLVWLKVPNMEAYNKVAEQIESSSQYSNPAVKCETASSGIASWLDAYRDLLWGMRYLLVPAILATMSLVIANAISISVRERRKELAVLKVLGYSPSQLLVLVLGEALIIGVGSGMFSSWSMYYLLNHVAGGLKFPIAFFPAFLIPTDALWWGPLVGGATAFAGSIFPAWNASRVKVTEVFSRVA